MASEQEVLNALSNIIDPDFQKDIVSLGFIKNLKSEGNAVSFSIQLTTAACPVKTEFKRQAEQLVGALPGVERVFVNMTSQTEQPRNQAGGLTQVKNIIAVASCKGGVGKSTVAALLAGELAARGLKTGLLDTDLFGPSIPTLFHLQKQQVTGSGNTINPVEHNGIKMMSFGWLIGDGPAIMRGPMVANHTNNLLHNVNWGELDYLILDMPPGTGDVQLTIAQSVSLSGAVIVTTRASLALADVSKGILMFETVNVPMLGIVENMSHFVCDNCDKKHLIFGPENSILSDRFGLDTLAQLPLTSSLSSGFHVYKSEPSNSQFADQVIMKLGKLKQEGETAPDIKLLPSEVNIAWPDGSSLSIPNKDLRNSCGCAHCIDENTGKKILKEGEIPSDIHAESFKVLGNYAFSVAWSDGHTSSIYPYKRILKKFGV